MPRLIDADVLMESLKRKKCETAKVRYTEGYNDALMRFRSMVHNAPTVEERKQGHWEYWCGRLPRCPVCGYEYTDLVECKNYCGNCGAIMNKED